LVKNGKYYIAPQNNGDNFKQLFARLAAEGAGRPVDTKGVPDGPWTPELLTDAICAIDANQAGIEIRTVQIWFQENDNGIGAENIRWLARIFGCNDPESTSQWQVRLQTAKTQLTNDRRAKQNTDKDGTGSQKRIRNSLAEKLEWLLTGQASANWCCQTNLTISWLIPIFGK
tara:strand:+ start:1159 stop:1674 length:516 start_codon:yes stop_codon:yes gene_type:complete